MPKLHQPDPKGYSISLRPSFHMPGIEAAAKLTASEFPVKTLIQIHRAMIELIQKQTPDELNKALCRGELPTELERINVEYKKSYEYGQTVLKVKREDIDSFEYDCLQFEFLKDTQNLCFCSSTMSPIQSKVNGKEFDNQLKLLLEELFPTSTIYRIEHHCEHFPNEYIFELLMPFKINNNQRYFYTSMTYSKSQLINFALVGFASYLLPDSDPVKKMVEEKLRNTKQ